MTNFASALLISITCIACAPVATQTTGGDPAFATEAAPGQPLASQQRASCESACRHVISTCGLEDDGTCPGECHQLGLAEATLERLQRATCEEAVAIIAEVSPPQTAPEPQAQRPSSQPPAAPQRTGSGCMSNGTQDCPYLQVCCRNNEYTTPGFGSGLCISPAICLMPTR